jgi:hypothetical protein
MGARTAVTLAGPASDPRRLADIARPQCRALRELTSWWQSWWQFIPGPCSRSSAKPLVTESEMTRTDIYGPYAYIF